MPAAASWRRALWGVLEVPSGLVGTTHTDSNSNLMEDPCFEKLADFPLCHVNIKWIGPCGPSALLATKKGLIRRKDMPSGNPPDHGTKKIGPKNDFLFYLNPFWVKKWYVGSKNGALGCLGLSVR